MELARRGIQRIEASARGRRAVWWLLLVATIGMFIIVVMGTLVTNTGSQRGCGDTWPLCNGRLVPLFSFNTLIEFSHRAVVPFETLLVLAATVGVLIYWRNRLEIKLLAPAMVIFLFAQALLGGLAVMFPESPEALALHFGVSLLSFASVLVTFLFVWELERWDKLRDRPIPSGFHWLVWGMAIYTYLVVYTGAYVRHKGVELACTGWPLCNGQVLPNLANGVGIVFTHRVAAFVLVIGTVWLLVWSRRMRAGRPDLYWGSVAALVTVILQALEGAYVVESKVNIPSTLAHGATVALLFGALCYLAIHAARRPAAARKPLVARPAQESIAAEGGALQAATK